MKGKTTQPDAALLGALIEALPTPLLVLEQNGNRTFSVVMGNAAAWRLFACSLVSPDEEVTGVLECLTALPGIPAGGDLEARERVAERLWRVNARHLPAAGGSGPRYALTFLPVEDEAALGPLPSGMLSDMSHELRTPLNAIIGFAELIENEVFGPLGNEQYRHYVGGIRESGVNLLATINDVLHLAAPAGPEAAEERKEGCDLCGILQLAVDVYGPRFRKLGRPIAYAPPPRPFKVSADPAQLEQALFCLMDSGLRLIPEHGGVSLAVAADGEGAVSLTIDLMPSGRKTVRSEASRDYNLFNEQSVSFSLAKKYFRLQGGDMTVRREAAGHVRIRATLPACQTARPALSSVPTQKKIAFSG